jgi:hypothetical protein
MKNKTITITICDCPIDFKVTYNWAFWEIEDTEKEVVAYGEFQRAEGELLMYIHKNNKSIKYFKEYLFKQIIKELEP